MERINIFIVDKQPIFRQGLRRVLSVPEDMYVVGECSPDDNIWSLIENLLPDIVLFQNFALKDMESLTTPLSHREMEILKYVAEGNPNKGIAITLNISEQTIKNHITSIMRKLNANDRTHAVVLAIRKGWLSIEKGTEIRTAEKLIISG